MENKLTLPALPPSILSAPNLQSGDESKTSLYNRANKSDALSDEALKDAALKFETAFIAQMLTYSGLGRALTQNGGAAMEPFSSFYVDALAKDIAGDGGFGLAASVYENLRDKHNGPQNVQSEKTKGETHGDYGRL